MKLNTKGKLALTGAGIVVSTATLGLIPTVIGGAVGYAYRKEIKKSIDNKRNNLIKEEVKSRFTNLFK